MTGLSPVNRLLNKIAVRAEQNPDDQLRETFADSGITVSLESINNQVIYGRRGTGKTHTLRHLQERLRDTGDLAIYIDLRTIGSPGSVINEHSTSLTVRASNLLVDLLHHIHDAILEATIDDDSLISDARFVDNLDSFLESITTLVVDGTTEIASSMHDSTERRSGGELGGILSSAPEVRGSHGHLDTSNHSTESTRTVSGSEHLTLNFSDISLALRNLATSLTSRRIWILLDEWISIPADVQPVVGEFLTRCITPNPTFTVKICSIEQQSKFRDSINGNAIGIELGADFTADTNLDELLVYEGHEEQSLEFFRELFYNHLRALDPEQTLIPSLTGVSKLTSAAFTEKRSFEELVRAAEGVPRDAINIAAKAARAAKESKISVAHIRAAARSWYESDKKQAIKREPRALAFLNWSIDTVIREKKARGFLLKQEDSDNPLITFLFDARLLHLVRSGYSARKHSGERFDVWTIDYGAYVDLMKTKAEPDAPLLWEESGEDPEEVDEMPDAEFDVEVPTQDLRSLRSAVLDIREFEKSHPSSMSDQASA